MPPPALPPPEDTPGPALPVLQAARRLRQRGRARFVQGAWTLALWEFVAFGIKQGWASLFGALMLAVMIATFWLWPADAGLHRYDALTLLAVSLQAAMLVFRLETVEEARVIAAFHLAGTAMELFKVGAGSWHYPGAEDAVLVIGGVPLFSGFLYASVGSYIARVWRLFDFRFTRFPPLWAQGALAAAVYANFFTHHFGPDIRLALFAAAALLYGPCVVYFRPDERRLPMPLLLGFGLVALFIWIAENIATYTRIWLYPGQDGAWQMVSLGKYGSWFLLMLLSFVLVAALRRGDAFSSAAETHAAESEAGVLRRPREGSA